MYARWTTKEKKYVRENAPHMTRQELVTGLRAISPPGVSRDYNKLSQFCKRNDIQIKTSVRQYWTPEVEAYIRENTPGMSFMEIMRKLREKKMLFCHPETMRSKCKAEGVPLIIREKHAWTKGQVFYLTTNYGTKKTSTMARELGLPYKSVAGKINRMFSNKKKKEKEIVSPWMDTMREEIPEQRKNLIDYSQEKYDQGKEVEIIKNKEGQFALQTWEAN